MKAKTVRSRKELLQRVGMDLGRELSTQTIFFHEIVARRLALNATDIRCLDLIARAGGTEVTAGDLGKATGLTTGAVTGIVDRLEAAGMVERVRDDKDRRRIIVRPKPDGMRRLGPFYDRLGAEMTKLASSYKTEELELIDDFLEQNLALLKKQIADLS